MLTTQTTELLGRLKSGSFDPADIQSLEQTSAHDFRADLDSTYQIRFQERNFRDKWEVGMARSLRFELASFSPKQSYFPILVLIPVFHNCLFLSGDGDMITGVSVATRLVVRHIRKPFRGLALTKGRGFKLDRTPDGWDLKVQAKRTVKLTDEFLQKHGWRFDAVRRFISNP